MRRIALALAVLLARTVFAQPTPMTPQQVMNASAAWGSVPSSVQLEQAQVGLLSLIAVGTVLTPNQVFAQAAQWGAVTSEIQLLQAQAWLLSSIQTNLAGGYGASSPNALVQPNPNWFSASDWNPIVVFNCGTPAANGSYFQSATNTVAGLPYAVWTNSTGSSYRLVLNNTNIVPTSIFSNLWTIESTINVNFAYDMQGPTVPFGTWEVSGLGGIAGVSPSPSFNPRPPILVGSSNAANSVLTISPGLYDHGGYVWFPTNQIVLALGATISTMNGNEGLHPVGSFQMYGGSFSNGAWFGVGSGSVCVRLNDTTNYVSFFLSKLFGLTDTISGTINSDNYTLSINCSELGDNWDVVTFAKVTALSNVVFTAVGSKFYSKTNGISTASSLITPGANQTRVSGCYLEQGLGFLTGGGLLALTANTTNEVNGCVVITRNNDPKYQQSNGTLIVDGVPVDITDYTGNITFPASTFYPTNLATAAPNMRVPWSILPVAVSTTFTPLTGVDTTGRYMQIAKMYVTNSAAGTITLTMPANVVSVGSTTVTRRSILEWQVWSGGGLAATNCIITPIN